jgi:adenylate kinase
LFKNWILDGFPRTVKQARLLDAHLNNSSHPLHLVAHLHVPEEAIIARIQGEDE